VSETSVVEIPETRFARSGDVSIAYQVAGEGPFDVVRVPAWVSHVELGWTAPPFDESAGRKRECSPSPMAPRARARVCGREGAHASVDLSRRASERTCFPLPTGPSRA
jgi:hypothetical protein